MPEHWKRAAHGRIDCEGRWTLKRGRKTVAFAKRRADGTFKENDSPKRAIPADRRRKAKKTVKSGYGDQGDRAKKR